MGLVFRDVLERVCSQSLWDALRVEFKQLHQSTMTVSKYTVRFSKVSRYAPTLVSTARERVYRGWSGGILWIMFVPGLSLLKAQLIVEKECDAYISFVRVVSDDTLTIESISVVRDYPDAFPADLQGMSPDKDIDFGIDLLLVTQPISIPPYHMALVELKELKEKLQ
ncbi:uncharacterized protein [Nicotiana tomentosiformis]|uniref:uncharacterized protein n=1 Tax=Nicotiana tomentosiformis TaxID=4098 RepID=UPI00388C9F93